LERENYRWCWTSYRNHKRQFRVYSGRCFVMLLLLRLWMSKF
jgi:hypothetical protein